MLFSGRTPLRSVHVFQHTSRSVDDLHAFITNALSERIRT